MSETPELDWWEVPLWKWRNDRSQVLRTTEIDYQRQRVYDAETASGVKQAPQRQFSTIEECQMYVNYVLGSAYFKRRFGEFTIEAFYRPPPSQIALGIRKSDVRGKIFLPRWAFTEYVIIHEMTHCLTPAASGGAHGRRWCRAYMDLIGYHLGRSWESKLRKSFIKYGVKSTPKRPANVIGEECAKLRSQYYTKSTVAKLAPATDTFPETLAEVCEWIEKAHGWAPNSVKMRRILVPGRFEFFGAPGLKTTIEVNVYRLADLTFGEWLQKFEAGLTQA